MPELGSVLESEQDGESGTAHTTPSTTSSCVPLFEVGQHDLDLATLLRGPEAAGVHAFGAWLAETTGLPVTFWDERFSTVEAESALWQAGLNHKKRKARRDRVAAQIVLQSYLDAGCPDAPATDPLG